MTFEEIPIRMMQLGVDRAWLAAQCDYSMSTLANALARNGTNKTDKALRRIWDALDREEDRQKNPVTPAAYCQVVVRPDVDQFTKWNEAALEKKLTVEAWCIEALNNAAREGYFLDDEPTLRTGIDEPDYPARDLRTYSIPLFRAAAGTPILSDAEIVELDHNPGEGRFLLELRGDSMEPQFRHRQRVILRHKSTLKRPLLKYGEFYAFIVDGLVTFKQWAKDDEGNKVLHSLNPEHPDIPADETTDWIGWFDAKDNPSHAG